jgi:hypothetical protein
MIKSDTQAGRLLIHLQSGRSINRLTALIELGIFELSARLIELQNHGFKLNKERMSITNRYGEKTSVVEYTLEQEKVAA